MPHAQGGSGYSEEHHIPGRGRTLALRRVLGSDSCTSAERVAPTPPVQVEKVITRLPRLKLGGITLRRGAHPPATHDYNRGPAGSWGGGLFHAAPPIMPGALPLGHPCACPPGGY